MKYKASIIHGILFIFILYMTFLFNRSNVLIGFILAVFIAFLGWGVSIFFFHKIQRPINALSAVMAKIAQGDLTAKIEMDPIDNFGELSTSFNQMIAELRKSKLKVEEYSTTLEKKVEQRTKDLNESMEELEKAKIATLNILEDVNKVNEELVKTKEYLESLVESLVDPIITTDIKGIITSFDGDIEEVIGYKRNEMLGKHVSICYKDGIDEAKKIMKILEEEGKLKNYEVLYRTKEGKELPGLLSVSYIRDASGQIIGTLGISKDLSERKKLENELRKTKDFLESIVEGIIDGICVLDKKGSIKSINKGAEQILGYSRGPIIGTHVSEYYLGGLEESKKIMQILQEEGKLTNYETALISEDGRIIPTNVSASLLVDKTGDITGSLGVFKDITERKRLEIELKETKEFLENVVESSIDAIVTTNYQGMITFLNKGAQDLTGFGTEVIGTHVSEYYSGGMKEAQKIHDIMKNEGRVYGYETLFTTKNGNTIPIDLSVSILKEKDEAVGTIGVFKDITEKKQLENEVIETKEYLERLVESANDIIYTLDLHGNFTFINEKIQEMGFTKENLLGKSLFSVMPQKYKGKQFRDTLLLAKKQTFEVEMEDNEGRVRNVHLSTSPLYDTQSALTGFLVVARDISDRIKLEKELESLSITDNLTGLYNQRHFYNELEKELERSKRIKRAVSLLLFDIDEFKRFNDTFGHLEGDRILQTVGEVVTNNIRENVDSGYRYGGDEFMVILPETNRDRAFSVAERIKESLSQHSEYNQTTLSIGLVEYKGKSSLKTFIKHADEAMYDAKHLGGNKICVYE